MANVGINGKCLILDHGKVFDFGERIFIEDNVLDIGTAVGSPVS